MNNFELMTNEEIAEIINTALDTGDWHTPSTDYRSIELDKLSSRLVRYGTCKVSLHSNYHDELYWFNINKDSVHIWQDSSLPGRSKTIARNIYRIRDLIALIDKYTLTPTS